MTKYYNQEFKNHVIKSWKSGWGIFMHSNAVRPMITRPDIESLHKILLDKLAKEQRNEYY